MSWFKHDVYCQKMAAVPGQQLVWQNDTILMGDNRDQPLWLFLTLIHIYFKSVVAYHGIHVYITDLTHRINTKYAECRLNITCLHKCIIVVRDCIECVTHAMFLNIQYFLKAILAKGSRYCCIIILSFAKRN